MGFACATKQKNSPVGAGPGEITVNTLSQKQDASKLLSMVDNVVVRNRAYRRAHRSDAATRKQAYGRLNKSVHDLAETAEQFRKDGQP